MKFKILFLALLTLFLFVPVAAQTPKPSTELLKLRDEYVKLTKEYKASLDKLLPLYEAEVNRAEDKLKTSEKLLEEGLAPSTQVEESRRSFVAAKEKVREIQQQMSKADQEITDALDDAKFFKDYREAVQQRRKARKPRCTSWTMTARHRSTSDSVSYSYRFVCQN